MSTTYPGDPTATEAPSVKPTPGVVPSVVIPADGEALNIASITQALKVLADFEAWLMSPRSKTADWAIPMQLWRSAQLHRRFGIDHLGLPMGRLQLWQQNWEGDEFVTAAGAVLTSNARSDTGWRFHALQQGAGSSAVGIQDPGTAGFPQTRFAILFTGNTAGDYSVIEKSAACRFGNDVTFAMEWEHVFFSLPAYTYAMGFNDRASFVAGGHAAIAQFYGVGAVGNWRCQTDNGTTLTDVDSGVALALGTRARFRIEYHGSILDDSGVERVLFFINGVLVANITTTMPSLAASTLATPFFGQLNSGGVTGVMQIGTVRFGAPLWPSDAF